MKKFRLTNFNKNALKTVALLAATGLVGYDIYSKQHAKTIAEKQVADLNDNLVKYKNNTATDQVLINPYTGSETITISKKTPQVAIIYHNNGDIALVINGEYLSLTDAMQKYPALTADIQEYIAATHTVPNVQNYAVYDTEAVKTME